jgi:uncharacterized protein (DUF2126 family)
MALITKVAYTNVGSSNDTRMKKADTNKDFGNTIMKQKMEDGLTTPAGYVKNQKNKNRLQIMNCDY